ncbi:hypothetical protein QA612_15935 [Evansella sp. AB-P1]|uniref:hypothetical protein n=1 Tax=Evansella sp. AB-P1 TaxID=3037653 RepID=UPI00241FE54F|nr:hypothetical protein [Evansella sp. AB-P1]MDG5788947.1 hypothetical protein [Evansella sp. AB-P1]
MQEQRKGPALLQRVKIRFAGTEDSPALLQRVKKKFAGTEEEASVAAKGEKEVCRHRGRVQRCCKG